MATQKNGQGQGGGNREKNGNRSTNAGNFANDPARAAEAGRKGGEAGGSRNTGDRGRQR